MDSLKFLAVIPARYASTRFPGKPLARLGGEPVIRHVWKQVTQVFADAAVATDDPRIYDAVEAFGGRAVMTSPDHRSGTDRCREAVDKLGGDPDVIVNVQGDEPFIAPSQLQAIARCFDDPSTDIATLVKPFTEADGLDALENPNSPKVVLGSADQALYFSRSVIPYLRGVPREEWLAQTYRHVRLPPRDVVQGDRPAPVGTRTGRIARTVAVAGKRVPHPCRYLRRRDDRHRHAGGFGEGGRILKIKNEKLRIGNQGGGFGRTTVARSHAKPDPDFNPRLSTANSRLMNTTFIAGPCVIESAELLDTVAARLTEINRRLGVQIIFKASFDKANRTSIRSYRGVGMEKGLQMLADVRSKWGLRLLTDIHESWQAAPVGEVVDVIQIPAFLCRQTDLLVAAAKTGRTVNIKKAQFLSGEDMRYPYEKACDAGAADVWLTERGNSFGYNNLVVDFRNIPDMLRIAPTVVMDCTHSVQRPGAAGGKTGGNREFVPAMALAAKAFGANGYFFEVHPDPDHALSDGPNMLNLNDLEGVVKSLL